MLHRIDLSPGHEAVSNHIHKMHQRNIKIEQTKGVCIQHGSTDDHMRAFYNLHVQTRQRQGVPVQPWSFFFALTRLIETGSGFISLAYCNGECIAGAIFLHSHRILTYKYGASTIDGLNLRPYNLLFWDAIRWGCENEYLELDLGRTEIENSGLRKFKSGWGAEEQPLIYTTISDKPPNPSSKNTKGVMQLIVRNTPSTVCRITGDLLYKHFG